MILSAKHVITGDGVTVVEDGAVYIDDSGKIREIGKKDALNSAHPREKTADYPTGSILPGLIDLHAHLGHWLSKPPLMQHNDYMMGYITLYHAQRAFERGITTLRDVCSPEYVCMTLEAAGKKGYFQLPRMQYCGKALCITGGHGSAFGEGEGVDEVDGPWELKKAIRARFKHGASWIKIMTSHRTELSEFSQEELDTAVMESHRLGGKIAVHSGTQPSIGMCIDAGFDTIEHATFVTEEQVERMIRKGISWTPTILPYTTIYNNMKQLYPDESHAPGEYFYCKAAADAYKNNFKKFYDMGILIGAGTDNILPTGETDLFVARELEYMAEYGITPLQAIEIGTKNGAQILGLETVTGQLKAGLAADILVVEGNAAEDIEALKNVRTVFREGKIVYTNPENAGD